MMRVCVYGVLMFIYLFTYVCNLYFIITCQCKMSSSKSKKRGSSEVEESVDMDVDIQSEHQPNDPI